MSPSDTQERAVRLRRPAVVRARELGLPGRRTALAATLHSQLCFQASLMVILDERAIPEVQELLEHLQRQMHDTTEHLNNVQVSLGRQDEGSEHPG